MMMILRHPTTGEQVVTASRDGYRGWKLVEKNVARPRGHAVRVQGRWRIDRERGRVQTLDDLRQEIAELAERLEKLEAMAEIEESQSGGG